jgi:hypothetical protein
MESKKLEFEARRPAKPPHGRILPTVVSHLNALEAKWTSAWACPGLNPALTTMFVSVPIAIKIQSFLPSLYAASSSSASRLDVRTF